MRTAPLVLAAVLAVALAPAVGLAVVPTQADDLGVAGGALPDGARVDDTYPGVARLDPSLRDALRAAAADASAEGVVVEVTSGWRSEVYQARLVADAVREHGSRAEAARWVADPTTSLHVSGDAVDVGGADALAWLGRHGSRYGLCQVYDNEPWHLELRPEAVAGGCPPTYPDPSHDPRLRS